MADDAGRMIDGTPIGDVLGATEAAIDTADPVSLGRSYLGAMRRAARRPLHSKLRHSVTEVAGRHWRAVPPSPDPAV